MKSIKPGRGNSFMGGFGSLVSVVFGILWTVLAFSLVQNAPFPVNIIFPLFGVVFVLVGIGQAVFHFNNATRENRFSTFDVVDGDEEPDDLNTLFGKNETDLSNSIFDGSNNTPQRSKQKRRLQPDNGRQIEGDFCPYCRANLKDDFAFCPKCGADI